jgi:tetratricopeptide (TPR) repeat protein
LIRAGGRGGTVGSEVQAFTWASYLLTQPGVIAHYLRLSFWPSGQSLDYAWPAARTVSQIVPPALLVLGLAGLTAWALRRRPSLGFIGAWFFLILAPTSSFVPLEDAAFEHRMYLALAAVVLLTVRGGYTVVAWGATRFPDVFRGRFSRRVTLMLPVAVVAAALTGATIARNRCYRTELAIWQDAADKSPANARAHNNLGNALDDAGQVGEAIRHYREALRWKPDYPDALNNLGAALASTGKVVEAVGCFREALEQKPDFPEARCNLDTALRHIHGTGPASYPRRPAHPPPAEAPQPQRN